MVGGKASVSEGHSHQSEEAANLLAWCFLPRDSRWRRRDPWGDRLLVATGKTFCALDMAEMRRRHLDAWERPLDALHHAAGLIVCRVQLSGTIEREGHARYYIAHGGGRAMTRKGMIRNLPVVYEGVGRIERLYASQFRVLWTGDATLTVHHFACDLTERALRAEQAAGREPDERAWAMVVARRAWLENALADEGLKTAWTAFNIAINQHWQRRPPGPYRRPMTDRERHDLSLWSAHSNALSAVRYATEPVPLAAGKSIQNVKSALAFAVEWRKWGETQEQRIAMHAAQTEVINAEIAQRLCDCLDAKTLCI